MKLVCGALHFALILCVTNYFLPFLRIKVFKHKNIFKSLGREKITIFDYGVYKDK